MNCRHVLNRVELGTFGWYDEACRHVPAACSTRRTAWTAGSTAAAISARCRFVTLAGSGLRLCASLWAYRTEDVGGGGTLVTRCAWLGAAFLPAAGSCSSGWCEPRRRTRFLL